MQNNDNMNNPMGHGDMMGGDNCCGGGDNCCKGDSMDKNCCGGGEGCCEDKKMDGMGMNEEMKE